METVAESAFSPETHTVGGTWPKRGAWQFQQTTMSLLGMVLFSPCLRQYQTCFTQQYFCLFCKHMMILSFFFFLNTVDSYRVLTNQMPLFVETLQVSNRKKKDKP